MLLLSTNLKAAKANPPSHSFSIELVLMECLKAASEWSTHIVVITVAAFVGQKNSTVCVSPHSNLPLSWQRSSYIGTIISSDPLSACALLHIAAVVVATKALTSYIELMLTCSMHSNPNINPQSETVIFIDDGKPLK